MKNLYIHIPFCERKCFYCSFVVSIGQEQRMDDYINALEIESRHYGKPNIDAVYFGGGTPSLLSEEQLKRLVSIVRENFILPLQPEWTIEANPEKLDDKKLNMFFQEGINRVSLGIQSLNDGFLGYLGRNHNAKLAVEAYQRIRTAGFTNISVDLMFSFPDQTPKQLEEDIESILSLGSEHISLYALTIEQNSKFYAQKVCLQEGEVQAQHYATVCRLLTQAGYEQYEVSNFARPGFESVHNINYWRGGDYIGLGIGAHSHEGIKRSWNVDKLTEYLALIEAGESAEQGAEQLSARDQMNEALLFGLRMNEGVSLEDLEASYAEPLTADQLKAIEEMIEGGFLDRNGPVLKATDKGRVVLDEISARLI